MANSSRAETRPQEISADELANTLTHGVGLLLSLAGMCWLLTTVSGGRNLWPLFGCSVYAGSMVAVYAASTLYHGVQSQGLKHALRVADHVCIYLFIAGTYTPFLLTFMMGPWGMGLLILVWCCALLGSYFKVVHCDRIDNMSYLPYVAVGWLAILGGRNVLAAVPTEGVYWILAGGVLYTVGVYFVINDHRRYFHAVWHLFVMAASGCHFYAVWRFAVPHVV